MSNLTKANHLAGEWVKSMGGLEAVRHDHNSDLSGLIQALDDAGLLMPDVQIIRTVKELEGLDPDAVTVDNEETIENANMWLDDSGKPYPYDERFLPAAVLATGAQFRAALEAMERDDG